MVNEENENLEDEIIGGKKESISNLDNVGNARNNTPSPSLLDGEQQPSSELASSDIILPTQNYVDQKIEENDSDSFKHEIQVCTIW